MFTKIEKYASHLTLGLLTMSMLTFSSCNNDDDEDDSTNSDQNTVVTSYDYDFANASYSGQTERLALLGTLSSKAKGASAASTVVTAEELQTLFDAESENGKKLSNKTEEAAVDNIKGWFADLGTASASTVAATDGTAGRLDKSEGKTYLFDAKGFEPAQLIEKGIMGACFYYQATGVEGYLSDTDGGLLADNSANAEGQDYTELQHHWDEGFGYLGAPTTFSSENTDGSQYHAKYSLKGEAGDMEIADNLMKAFYLGRKAIDDKDLTTAKAQALEVKKQWELAIVAAGIYYLNSAAGDSFSNDAARMHELSEAYAFIWSLKFNENKVASVSQVDEVLALLGDNFWTIEKTDIEAASKKLAELYSIDEAVRAKL
jgi:hypothetical protein